MICNTWIYLKCTWNVTIILIGNSSVWWETYRHLKLVNALSYNPTLNLPSYQTPTNCSKHCHLQIACSAPISVILHQDIYPISKNTSFLQNLMLARHDMKLRYRVECKKAWNIIGYESKCITKRDKETKTARGTSVCWEFPISFTAGQCFPRKSSKWPLNHGDSTVSLKLRSSFTYLNYTDSGAFYLVYAFVKWRPRYHYTKALTSYIGSWIGIFCTAKGAP